MTEISYVNLPPTQDEFSTMVYGLSALYIADLFDYHPAPR